MAVGVGVVAAVVARLPQQTEAAVRVVVETLPRLSSAKVSSHPGNVRVRSSNVRASSRRGSNSKDSRLLEHSSVKVNNLPVSGSRARISSARRSNPQALSSHSRGKLTSLLSSARRYERPCCNEVTLPGSTT